MNHKHLILALTLLAGGGLSLQAQHRPAAKAKAPAKATAADPALKASLTRGAAVYKNVCIACHQADGGGLPPINPPLIKTQYVLGDKSRLSHIVLAGLAERIEIDGEEYKQPMPAQAHLTDQQIADVLTYVRNSFGNKASAVQVAEVKAVRATLK
ncbi:MAG TPA: cytochrome c [Hymenobacter sp.]|uniref:c-type cytochrome n=1 Tax=Hymenobacter sp. TaxID=1898978 RepID=UPI002D80E64B|nr:cytochrome c [Hymenobacter sp.]HET9504339.1 cytochrome c [Hymenobacter sp.]